MVVRGWHGDGRLAITLATGSLTVGSNDREVAACDRAGRLYSFYRDGHTWRRGLNGRVLHKWRDSRGRGREVPGQAEADEVIDAAAALFAHALAARADSRWRWTPAGSATVADELVVEGLRRAASFDSRAAMADALGFASVYRPIGILPPDQYLALVLQATEGCSFGSCAFCDLYRDPYRVRSVEEFRRHVALVRDYLGASLLLRRRSIFLGAANALAVPMARLVPIFETMTAEFPSRGRRVHAFVDAFTGMRKREADYRVLARLGLSRVYIGLESGHDPLLALVSKPGAAGDAVETVRTLKASGVNVGVIVIIGLGGRRFADAHVRDTARSVNQMRLGPADLLYLSDLVEQPGTAYPGLARARAIEPLEPSALRDQRARLRAGLEFVARPPRIATYDIREFVY